MIGDHMLQVILVGAGPILIAALIFSPVTWAIRRWFPEGKIKRVLLARR